MRDMASYFRKEEQDSEEMQDLKMSLEDTKQQIARAYAWFNSASDSDLIESYVYEISALQARYNYLLRRIKCSSACAAAAVDTQAGEAEWT